MSNNDYPHDQSRPDSGEQHQQSGQPGYGQSPQNPRGQQGGYNGPPAQDNYSQQGGYGGPSAPPPAGGFDVMQESKGFFGALFDFSFTHFVTPMIVKAVYMLVMIVLVLGWLGFTLVSFSQSAGGGLVVFVLGAVVVVVYLALARMTLEFYLAVVRMSEDIHQRLH